MAITPLDSALWGGVYGDAEAASFFSDAAELAAMVRFEVALAAVQGRLGVIPVEAAETIARALADWAPEPSVLAAGTGAAGVPVPGLVAALRDRIGGEAASWLHWGATSQDVLDTALMLRIRGFLALLDARLDVLSGTLADGARRWRDVPMAGRTRSQIATPITFGLRIAGWLGAVLDLHEELPMLRQQTLRVQLGGASGSVSAMGTKGIAVGDALAAELGLTAAAPWQTDRGRLVAIGGWLARLAGACGKMAGDLILMGRSEIAEARAGAGGGSSTMPQKSNPVSAEAAVALSRFAAGLMAPLAGAMIQAEERDATGWAVEWMVLPQLGIAAAGALRHAQALADTIEADPEAMARNLALGGGAALAEAASFALAAHMPRADAQALVKSAANSGKPLAEALATLTDAPVDWQALGEMQGDIAAAAAMVDRVLVRMPTKSGRR